MFVAGQKVVRKNDEEKNKKWPAAWLNRPIRIVSCDGSRIWFEPLELANDKGWVASRFISEDDPSYNPLSRFF